jgi:hypothetical protein
MQLECNRQGIYITIWWINSCEMPSALKTYAVYSPETLVYIYKSAWRYHTEDQHRRDLTWSVSDVRKVWLC